MKPQIESACLTPPAESPRSNPFAPFRYGIGAVSPPTRPLAQAEALASLVLVLFLWPAASSLGAAVPLDGTCFEAADLRGPDHAVFQRIIPQVLADGRTVYRTNEAFRSLGTGMHIWDGGWQPADDSVRPIPGGAIADRTRHTISWASDITTPGGVRITLPSPAPGAGPGPVLRLHLLGVAITDYATGASELVATPRPTLGVIAGSQVVWEDAFDGASITVRWRNSRAGPEQDLLFLRNDLEIPQGWNPDTARIELWTELVEFSEPVRTRRVLYGETVNREAFVDPDMTDDLLDWGTMRMDLGQIYMLDPAAPDGVGEELAPCGKSWIRVGQRQFIVEKLDYRLAREHLARLPQAAAVPLKRERNGMMAAVRGPDGIRRPFPPAPVEPAQRRREPMQMAAAAPRFQKGLLWDFVLLSGSQTNVSLDGAKTYVISNGTFSCFATLDISPGVVVKFSQHPTVNRILVYGPLECRASPHNASFFVAASDDSVGEVLPGSSGTPGSDKYAWRALHLLGAMSYDIRGLRFRNANRSIYANLTQPITVAHTQIGQNFTAIEPNGRPATLRNVLIYDSTNAFSLLNGTGTPPIVGEHLTLHRLGALYAGSPSSSSYPRLTNSLLISITNNNATNFVGGPDVKVVANDTGIFTTVGAGARYLADNTYRNLGVGTINPDLAVALKRQTTFAPALLTTPIMLSTSINLIPRDNDGQFDIGFHYDCLDALVSNLAISNSTLTLYPTTALGVYGDSNTSGLMLLNGGRIISESYSTNHNFIVRYNMVQEQATTNWAAPSVGRLISTPFPWSTNLLPTELRLRFTTLAMPACGNDNFYANCDLLYLGATTGSNGVGTLDASLDAAQAPVHFIH